MIEKKIKRLVAKFVSNNKEEIWQNLMEKETLDGLYPIREECYICKNKLTPNDRIWCPFCGIEL